MSSKADAIAAIRADQQFWRDLAAEVGPDRYAEPGPMGEWSFGDMAGHLLGWRNRTLARLEAGARGEPEPANPWPAELDEAQDGDDAINAWIHEQHAGRPAAQLVADYDASYDRLVDIVESMPDEIVTDPNAFPWMGGTPLAEAPLFGHLHDEHVPSVRAWLAANPR
jgi:uncharacterized protein (TIGR03083 family)